MEIRTLGILGALLLSGALLSCGGGAPEAGSPGEAVQQFYGSLNDGDYAAAKRIYGAEARKVVDDPEFTSDAAFREWADSITRNGTVARVRILDATTDDGSGTVSYEVQYRDGSAKPGEVAVTLEEGHWKLGLVQ